MPVTLDLNIPKEFYAESIDQFQTGKFMQGYYKTDATNPSTKFGKIIKIGTLDTETEYPIAKNPNDFKPDTIYRFFLYKCGMHEVLTSLFFFRGNIVDFVRNNNIDMMNCGIPFQYDKYKMNLLKSDCTLVSTTATTTFQLIYNPKLYYPLLTQYENLLDTKKMQMNTDNFNLYRYDKDKNTSMSFIEYYDGDIASPGQTYFYAGWVANDKAYVNNSSLMHIIEKLTFQKDSIFNLRLMLRFEGFYGKLGIFKG